MALQTLNTIKNWFKTGLKPTQTQFWDTWDSFRHKYEKVLVQDVDGLDELLLSKADKVNLDEHLADKKAHAPQVNTDWNSYSGFSQLLNKPEFKTINGEKIVGTGDIVISNKSAGLQSVLDTNPAANYGNSYATIMGNYGNSKYNNLTVGNNTDRSSMLQLTNQVGFQYSKVGINTESNITVSEFGVNIKRSLNGKTTDIVLEDPTVNTLLKIPAKSEEGNTYTIATTDDFKTINGESIIGEGDINLSGNAAGLDTVLATKNYANSPIILSDYYENSEYYQGLKLSASTGNTILQNHYSGQITGQLELKPGDFVLRQRATDATGEINMKMAGGGWGNAPEITFEKYINGESSFCPLTAGDPLQADHLTTKRYVDSQILTKATIDSPIFTGIPNVPTAPLKTDTTQVASTAFVKTAIDNSIKDLRPYKTYLALLTQTEENDPTALVLENTLGGEVIWKRMYAGTYTATLQGAFNQNKTTVFAETKFSELAFIIGTEVDYESNTVYFKTCQGPWDLSDGVLRKTAIEIKVYN